MPLPKSDLFRGLSEAHLQRLVGIASKTSMTGGQWLLREGESGETVYLIENGAVELMVRVDDDFDLPISILRETGQCFGTSSLVAPYRYSISARCLEEGSLFVIKRTHLQKLIEEDSEFGRTVMTNLARQLLARLVETRRELIVHFQSIMKTAH